MAKVYDALKRLEAERSRGASRSAAAGVPTSESSRPTEPASGWLRWPWGAARRAENQQGDQSRLLVASADVARLSDALDRLREELPQMARELVRAVDSRLAEVVAREQSSGERVSEVEGRIPQELGDHFGHLARELDRRALAAIDQLASRVERLQARQSLLLAIAAAILLIVLVR